MASRDTPASSAARPVTIVVPIYDHWSSLERCIAALITHVDTSVHKVILVNDVGPSVDTIESLVRLAIAGKHGFEYYRNDENLGFLGTCNRAVFELDTSGNDILLLNSDAEMTEGVLEELVEVLYSAEHHGIVCPRSNNATIATVPFFRRSGNEHDPLTEERALQIFNDIKQDLPRYYVSPVSIGFCYLIKRSIIDNHGLFDPAFGTGYNEENDLCMRINAIGYSSLIANHAFVAHLGGASFGERKNELDARNHQILMSRYPFYIDAVENFLANSYAASDVFAEILSEHSGPRRSILIDIHHLSLVYNGSTRYALSFLRTLAEMPRRKNLHIVVAAQVDAIAYFDLTSYGLEFAPYDQVKGVFDVGIALAPVNHVDQLVQMNRHCARWVVSHFDIIASRSWALMLTDPLRPLIVEQSLAYADRVIALSDFTIEDAAAFYPRVAPLLAERAESVALGTTRNAAVGENEDHLVEVPLRPEVDALLTRGEYLVILGNFYPHKQVAKAVNALAELGVPMIAFGPLAGVDESETTVVITGGTLSEAQLHRVFENAALMVFPSAYEGFGLPIADAVDFGVPVIAFDTSVAREVTRKLKATKAVAFFSRFSDLPAVITAALADTELRAAAAAMRDNVRGLTPYNKKLWKTAVDLLTEPLDQKRLETRFVAINNLERVVRTHKLNANQLHGELLQARASVEAIRESRTFRTGAAIAKVFSPITRLLRR